MPRCDHQAQLISDNRYMLVYGGRNELAFSNNKNMNATLKPSISLDDIMIFDLKLSKWTAVIQHGSRPTGRWNASICYSEQT